ncbi:MAG: hypothetical protein JWO77_972 [Ilumatobacteraceae bacterium]|nr:hypothetical protein [Ilumatobacteraceae bacterium]
MRARHLFAAVAVASAALLVPLANPASAAVAATTSGTTVTVTATGNVSVGIGCSLGHVSVNGTVAQPSLLCSSVSKVTVNGDIGNQAVMGRDLNNTVFSANPKLFVALGDGADTVVESDNADTLDLGPGADTLLLESGGAHDTALTLGAGTDLLRVWGSLEEETISVSSMNADVSVVTSTSGGPALDAVASVESVQVESYTGDDTLAASGVTDGSNLTSIFFYAGDGDDTITASAFKPTYAVGGTGTNTYNGSSAKDTFESNSNTDVIKLAGGADNFVTDRLSLRSGGRTLTGSGSTDRHRTELDGSDTTTRVRPGANANTAMITNSLNRTGQQLLPANFDRIELDYAVGAEKDRALIDVRAVHQSVTVFGDEQDNDVLDITIPTGAWTENIVAGGTSTVNPVDPAYGSIIMNNTGAISVHGAWTNIYEGFGHRVIRDLQFRIAGDSERLTIRNNLAGSTTTRPKIITGLMDTDLYRGLDVDRTFVDYLDRQADPSGRTYWINSLHSGKSLVKFRAQLFGSNEYFTKAGGTNAQYMVAAYADVLGRKPDPSGQAYWTKKLNNGAERGQVALQFLASTEARRNIVRDQFLRFLDRQPTDGEITTWVSTLGSSTQGEQQLIAFLAASNEYYQRT